MAQSFAKSAGLKYTQIAAPGGSYRDQYGGAASYGDMHGQVLTVLLITHRICSELNAPEICPWLPGLACCRSIKKLAACWAGAGHVPHGLRLCRHYRGPGRGQWTLRVPPGERGRLTTCSVYPSGSAHWQPTCAAAALLANWAALHNLSG